MRVLVACETSGIGRRAFAARGHDVWSCDTLPAEDGSNRHIICDVRSGILAQTQGQLPEWLTVKEAAKYLRITPDTIRRKVRAGHFDTRRDGKNILISRESVLDQSSR